MYIKIDRQNNHIYILCESIYIYLEKVKKNHQVVPGDNGEGDKKGCYIWKWFLLKKKKQRDLK